MVLLRKPISGQDTAFCLELQARASRGRERLKLSTHAIRVRQRGSFMYWLAFFLSRAICAASSGGGCLLNFFLNHKVSLTLIHQIKLLMKTTRHFLFFYFHLIAGIAISYAQSGPDNSFGTNGKALVTTPNSKTVAHAVALQADGKIVIAGKIWDGSLADEDFYVARFNSNGSVDSTFNGKGWRNYDMGEIDNVATAVAIQSDGKIVVAGYSYNSNYEKFAVLRFNSDGSLDNTFGSGGEVSATPATYGRANAMAIQSDGKIVVGGYSYNTGQAKRFGVVRLNTNGGLDNTFAGTGMIAVAYADTGGVDGLVVQPDGKIVLAGENEVVAGLLQLVRITASGSTDNSFGNLGKVSTPMVGDFSGIALQADGKILLGVTIRSLLLGNNSYVHRFNSDGSEDNGYGESLFNHACRVRMDTTMHHNGAMEAICALPGGRTAVAGYCSGEFAVARIFQQGVMDTGFASGGYLHTGFTANSDAEAYAITSQPDGKLVVAGYRYFDGDYRAAVARYLPGDLSAGNIPPVDDESTLQVYPNPATANLQVRYTLTSENRVSISLLDMLGRVVAVPLDACPQSAGDQQVCVDVSALPFGTYLLVLQTINGSNTMLLVH